MPSPMQQLQRLPFLVRCKPKREKLCHPKRRTSTTWHSRDTTVIRIGLMVRGPGDFRPTSPDLGDDITAGVVLSEAHVPPVSV